MTTAIFPRRSAAVSPARKLTLAPVCLMFGILLAMPLSATVYRGEIVPGSVSATVGTGYDPVNGVSVTFRWTTLEPGNSIVVIENDLDYQGDNNSRVPPNCSERLRNQSCCRRRSFSRVRQIWRVGLLCGQFSGRCAACGPVFPAPRRATCGSPPAPGCGGLYEDFQSCRSGLLDPNGPLVFSLWPVGGQNLYQGDPTQSPACTPTSKSSRECNDLYIATQPNLLSGSPDAIVLMENCCHHEFGYRPDCDEQ